MARIRSIHPGVFTDEAFVSCSFAAQVLLFGLWTDADDQGVFEWKPVSLKMRLLPAANVDVAALLAELETNNIVRRYTLGDRQLGAVRNFRRFQRPRKPNALHPITTEISTYVALSAPSTVPDDDEADQVPQKSGNSPQMEDVGGRGKEESRKMPPPNGVGHDDDPEVELFRRGKAVLGSSAGGLIKNLLKAKGGKVALARAAIEQASTKQDPREFIGRIVATTGPADPANATEKYSL